MAALLERDREVTVPLFSHSETSLGPGESSLKSHEETIQTPRHGPATFLFLEPEVTWSWGLQPPATFLPGGSF